MLKGMQMGDTLQSAASLSDTIEEMHMKWCPILNPSVRPADQREARREADHDLCVMLLPRLPGRHAGCPAGLNDCGLTLCAILSFLTPLLLPDCVLQLAI